MNACAVTPEAQQKHFETLNRDRPEKQYEARCLGPTSDPGTNKLRIYEYQHDAYLTVQR